MKAKLMKLFLQYPDLYRSVTLTDNQIGIINAVSGGDYPTMSAREFSDLKGISIQSASQQLSNLWLRGYLTREERKDPTGGIIYRYRAAMLDKRNQG